jgi:hypothetical protein
MVGFMAMLWLLSNDYDSFVCGQVAAAAGGGGGHDPLTTAQFQRLRSYLQDNAGITNGADVNLMMTMLLVTNMYKVDSFSMQAQHHLQVTYRHRHLFVVVVRRRRRRCHLSLAAAFVVVIVVGSGGIRCCCRRRDWPPSYGCRHLVSFDVVIRCRHSMSVVVVAMNWPRRRGCHRRYDSSSSSSSSLPPSSL